jgi:glycogen operon protein
MTDHDWNKHYTRCLGMRLEGLMLDEVDERGKHIIGDTLLILFNSHNGVIPFRLPATGPHEYWQPILDTATETLASRMSADESYPLEGHSLALLKLVKSRKSLLTLLL